MTSRRFVRSGRLLERGPPSWMPPRHKAGALALVFLALVAVPASALAAGGHETDGFDLVSAIGLAIVTAGALAVLLSFVRVPALLAYIVAGLALGIFATPLLGESIHIMTHISHLGLVFLLFIIGLEMDLRGILRLGPRAALAVLLQAPIAIAAVLGAQYGAKALGFSIPGLGTETGSFLFFAVACALGSTAVVVKLLGDQFDLSSKAGKLTVLTLIAEDIWAVLALSYVLSQSGGGGGMALMLGGGAGLALFFVFFAKYVLSRLMRRFSTSPDMLLLVALGWCFLCAVGMSQVGLSAEMGALIAGLTIGRMPQHIEILAKVLSLRDFFMALFFVALGMTLPLPDLPVIMDALALVAIVILLRMVLFTPTLLWARTGPIVALTPPINLAQLSEFSLLLVPIGIAGGALSIEDGMVISYALMISVVITGFTIKKNYRIALALARVFGAGSSGQEGQGPSAAQHGDADVIMLGFHSNAEALIAELGRTNPDIVPRILVIDFNLENHARIAKAGLKVVYGDISNPETLRHHGIADAKVIVSTIGNVFLRGVKNQDLVAELKRGNPRARFIATADSEEEAASLRELGAFRAVTPPASTAPAYVRAIDEALQTEE